jgi:hypothetical protein
MWKMVNNQWQHSNYQFEILPNSFFLKESRGSGKGYEVWVKPMEPIVSQYFYAIVYLDRDILCD